LDKGSALLCALQGPLLDRRHPGWLDARASAHVVIWVEFT